VMLRVVVLAGSGTTPAIFMHNAALGCGVANNCFVTIGTPACLLGKQILHWVLSSKVTRIIHERDKQQRLSPDSCLPSPADNSVIMKAVVYDAWTGANVGEIPLTFGLTNPVSTSTENSFTVLDDGIFVINNVFRDYPPPNNWANYAVAKARPKSERCKEC
jgi:hypothetical protein